MTEISPIVVAALAAVTAAIRFWGDRAGRQRLKLDLEILQLLPQDATVRSLWLAQIERRIDDALERESERTRDPSGIVLALLFLAAGGVVTYESASGDFSGWWAALAAVLVLFGAVGLSQDAIPRRRDARGRPIREVP